MAKWTPKPNNPRNLREIFHWVYAQLRAVGGAVGGDAPGDPSTPVPPPSPGTHSHYLENLVNVGIPSKAHRNSLSYEESTGLWEADARSKTFIQVNAPVDAVSSAGDLWVVVPP